MKPASPYEACIAGAAALRYQAADDSVRRDRVNECAEALEHYASILIAVKKERGGRQPNRNWPHYRFSRGYGRQAAGSLFHCRAVPDAQAVAPGMEP